ncbi:MAG: DUF368 domain-containing protein, partial [Caldilinea sp.]
MESSVVTTPEFVTERKNVKDYVGVYAAGFAMGSADVVPGVSGGTVAFIVGIYEELIGSIRAVGRPVFWNAVIGMRWRDALRLINLFFLVTLGAGVLSAILILAPGIEWMLINQPIIIWSFFFGLVVASITVVAPRVKMWSITRWIALALGAVG